MRYCSGIQFVLDFEGSKNLSLVPFNDEEKPRSQRHRPPPSSSSSSLHKYNDKGDEVLQLKTTVAPFQRKKFGQIHLLNPARRAILKYKYSWKLCEVVKKEDMHSKAVEFEKHIRQQLRHASGILPLPPPSNKFSTPLSPRALKQLFANHQYSGLISYIDTSFPPQESSLQPSEAGIPVIDTNFPVVWNRPR